MTDRKLIIRAYLLYEFKLGRSASSASWKLCTAFAEGTARNWFQKFRSGNETLKDEPRAGRPISLNNGDLKATIESDSCLTCHKLASKFNVSNETIRTSFAPAGKEMEDRRFLISFIKIGKDFFGHLIYTYIPSLQELKKILANCK